LHFIALNTYKAQPEFIENKGQFNTNVQFQLNHNAGNLYFNNNSVTYQLFQRDKLYQVKHNKTNNGLINGHVYKTEFIGANTNTEIIGKEKKSHYYNYFLGSDSTKWSSNNPIYKVLNYTNLYPGIDLIYYEKNSHLKYDFVIQPGHTPKQIKIKYSGVETMFIKSGHLVIQTSLGNVIEQAPMAYQKINDTIQEVKCTYSLRKNVIQYSFPDGYDNSKELIIDPVLIFSTYSGSTSNNWGQTATYDNSGHLYAGSISFSIGYPTTLGPFQALFAGGNTDICITKFSTDGTSLIYSTYLGGNDNENPHSLVVNDNDELYMLGSTGSANFPVTANAYDNSFNGGDSWGFINGYIPYPNGIDLVVTKFSSSGNSLLSSTFVGGSKNDGINESGAAQYNNAGLCNFYADEYRGEIILDDSDNCYIASTTKSLDFPMVNASQNTNAGLQDAVLFSLNSNLSSLLWSTYYGGSQNDAAYSIQLNSNNQIYATGGTMSNNLNTSSNAVNPNFGGIADGFIVNYNVSGNQIAASYIGNSGYNQCYFVQIDINDDVFLYGLTKTTYPVIPSGIFNIYGDQFIHKINPSLTNTIFSTTIGTGSMVKTISPSAFLVSDCGLIYICGWGGLNGAGTTSGLPVTTGTNNNAYQSTTLGSDFYLAVFEEDMQSLLYGTYFGGPQSEEHVDGGTSRFDKNGKVYQAVCAGCFTNNDFPTSPGAWSSTNGSSTNCNLGVFKFAFEDINTAISVPNYFACIPNAYQFTSLSQGGNQYYWDFGDGNTSNLMDPAHLYADTGVYTVSLVVSDSISCILSDTATLQLNVYGIDNAEIIGDSVLCPGGIATLTAYGGSQYSWSPSGTLSSTTTQQVIANPTSTTTYMVIATDSCGVDTAFFELVVAGDQYQISNDSTICNGDSITLMANGGAEYRWYGNNIIYTDSASPIVFPTQSTYYPVEITTPNGCIFIDTVHINVDAGLPSIIIEDTVNICFGDSALLSVLNVNNATWSPSINLSDSIGLNIWTSATNDFTYFISSTNSCGSAEDSVQITVFGYSGKAYGDTTICLNDSALIYAEDGAYYFWYPAFSLSNPDSNYTYAFPDNSTGYKVIVENTFGCKDTFNVQVDVMPSPYVNAGTDLWIQYGEPVHLSGQVQNNIFLWESSEWLSCNNCLNPQISPTENAIYILHVTDSIGCQNSDTVEVKLEGVIFVPNTFTPNNDGVNDVFEIKGEFIINFKLWIYNRWGEQVYYTTNLTDYWDGTYKGLPAKIDGYVWRIEYSDYNLNEGKLKGHINLLR